MVLAKNKKGIFFTTLVLVIISLFVVSYTFYSDVQERKSIQKRIASMNNFLFSTEQDLARQMYISGYRTIFLFEKSITEKGEYIANINSGFQEAFFNGTLNGEQQVLLDGAKMSDIENVIKENAKKINVNISLSSPAFEVSQEDPWRVKVSLTSIIIMKDNANLAAWNKTLSVNAYIPMENNFEDPLYTINTNSLVNNKIIRSPYQVFVQDSDISNLSNHVNNGYYIASSNAPSFLDRLEGKTSASQNGIESIVNLQKLSQQGIQTLDKSVIDYIYFSSQNPSPLCIVAGMPAWFKVDYNNAPRYNITC